MGVIPFSAAPPPPTAAPAAIPTRPPSAPIAPWQDAEIQLILGTLRQIRTVCQYLDTSLASLDESLKGATQELRRAGVLEQAIDGRAELKSGTEKGSEYIAEATSQVIGSPYVRDWIGDEVTRIQLNWSDVARNVGEVDAALAAAQAKPDRDLPDSLATDVRAARAAVRVIILASASITIPLRLNQHLLGARPGQEVSFKSLFVDELPDDADRTEVLRRIAEAPASVDGVVDVASGNVIAVSPSRQRRRLSYIWEAVAFLAVAFIRGYITTAGGVRVPDAAALANLSGLAVLLVIFAAGAAFHLIVDLLKARQGAVGSPQWAGLDDWMLWLHAREVKVIASALALWVVFGSVLILNPGEGVPDAMTGFFAGYSFDSLADVVIKRFDAFAPEQIKKITSTVSGESATT